MTEKMRIAFVYRKVECAYSVHSTIKDCHPERSEGSCCLKE